MRVIDNFDDEIMELLQYGTRTIEGLIALFYRNLWAMSELRETLKQYEDLGTVEELQQAIEKQTAKKVIKIDSGVHDYEWDSKCPTCGNYLDDDEHHCECGQKLDWSE